MKLYVRSADVRLHESRPARRDGAAPDDTTSRDEPAGEPAEMQPDDDGGERAQLAPPGSDDDTSA